MQEHQRDQQVGAVGVADEDGLLEIDAVAVFGSLDEGSEGIGLRAHVLLVEGRR
ncbi:hypothetical protein D9M72_586840 [compost metagenome]